MRNEALPIYKRRVEVARSRARTQVEDKKKRLTAEIEKLRKAPRAPLEMLLGGEDLQLTPLWELVRRHSEVLERYESAWEELTKRLEEGQE